MNEEHKGEIILYQTDNGKTKIEVRLENESTFRKSRQVQTEGGRSVDYDPNTPESVEFFKIVQNKRHYAAHDHTAAERQVRKEQYEYCRGKFLNFRPLTKQRAWQLI